MKIMAYIISVLLFFLTTPLVQAKTIPGKINGIWKYKGYGILLDIKNNQVDFYELTKISCLFNKSSSLTNFLNRRSRLNLTDRNKLSFYSKGGITRYQLKKLNALPSNCNTKAGNPDHQDPEFNFEVFWHNFNENYAFFEIRNVDWKEIYQQYRPRVTANTSQGELYSILAEIIRQLNDGHVRLRGGGIGSVYSDDTGAFSNLTDEDVYTESMDSLSYGGGSKGIIAKHYLKNGLKKALNDNIAWGWVTEDIGYLSIDTMYGYTNTSLFATLKEIDRTMEKVTKEFKNAKGVIIDARWNPGGNDAMALQIAGHFTDQQLLAFTKKARYEGSFTPAQEIYIPWHALEPYTGPVVYLCSGSTMSAAEIFSMAMMAMPNVTSVGEPTYGILSDMHTIRLPNGWRVTLSNEVYTAIDGNVYEGEGIPVDIHLPWKANATYETHIKHGIDTAIALIEDKAK